MPDADPILASNPLDKYVPDYQALVVMYGELWRKASRLQQENDYLRGLCVEGGYEMRRRLSGAAEVGADAIAKAYAAETALSNERQTRAALETTIVTLRESAEFDAEMRRSLSASVEELKAEVASAGRALVAASDECARQCQAKHDALDAMAARMDAAVLREREECARLADADRGEVPRGPHAPFGLVPASGRGDGGSSEAASLRIAAAIRSRGGQ